MKGKTQIEKVQIIAEADIRNGNADQLKAIMLKLIKDEKYEDCEGIKRALNQSK